MIELVFTALRLLRGLENTLPLKTTITANPHKTVAKNSPAEKFQISYLLYFLLRPRPGPLGRPSATVFGDSLL